MNGQLMGHTYMGRLKDEWSFEWSVNGTHLTLIWVDLRMSGLLNGQLMGHTYSIWVELIMSGQLNGQLMGHTYMGRLKD